MNSKDFGVWEGEVTAELPAQPDAGVYFIGRIRTPWTERKQCPKNARESDAICTVELEERWVPALKDVASCTPPRAAVLDGPVAAKHRAAGAVTLRRPARHFRPEIAGAAESDRDERGEIARC